MRAPTRAQIKESITRRLARVAEAVRRAPRRLQLAVAATVVVAAGVGSELGPYLDQRVFLGPAFQLRAALGLAPRLDPSIRIILAEDKSLGRIGRHPTFGEWHGVARLLASQGFETIIVHGIHGLPSEVGAIEAGGTESASLFVAAAITDETSFGRAERLDRLDPGRMIGGQAGERPVRAAEKAVLPADEVLAVADGVGHINLFSGWRMPVGYQTEGARIVPNLALWAAPGLHWTEDGPADLAGALPISADGTLLVDWLDSESLRGGLVPLNVFYELGSGKVRGDVFPKLAERLAGGRIAILVSEAFTGARFIETPFGQQLSFVALTAMVNSVVTRATLREPLPRALVVIAWALGLLTPLWLTPRRKALYLGGAAAAALPIIGLGALLGARCVLPVGSLAAVTAVILGLHYLHLRIDEIGERAAVAKDLAMGKAVQSLLLPAKTTGLCHPWWYEVSYRPHGPMAGDWFQVFTDPADGSGRAVLAIGDVVGKGPSAALITAVIASTWHDAADAWRTGALDLADFALRLDTAIKRTFGGEQNTTISLVSLEGDGAKVVSCGAPRWLALRASENGLRVEKIRTRPCNPLGATRRPGAGLEVDVRSVELGVGDCLLAYTDGVLDNPRAADQFAKSLDKTALEPFAAGTRASIAFLLEQAGKEGVLPDDATTLLIQRVGAVAVMPWPTQPRAKSA